MRLFNFSLFTATVLLTGIFYCPVAMAQCGAPINTFPYTEDFEAAPAWTTGGTPDSHGATHISWAWGTPAKVVINSAGSGTKCWVVGGLSGSSYADGERSYVLSPCFDFTNLQRPYIQFKIFWESEYKYDGSNLQYSLNGGTTWTNVGAVADAVDCMNANWYNHTPITNLGQYIHTIGGVSTTYYALANPTNGWCGNIQASYPDPLGTATTCQGSNGSNGWKLAKHCMPYLANKPSVRFRFTFGAGTTCNGFEGIAFDSVSLSEAPANSGSFTKTCINYNTLSFAGTSNLPCTSTYAWNFGDAASGASNTSAVQNPTHTFSAAGTYTVSLTLSGGPCNAPATITHTLDIISVTPTIQNASCGAANGSINLTVTGGTGTYSYSWNGGAVTQNISNLSAGNYRVTVSETGSCSATATAAVTQPSSITASTAVTNTTCGNGIGAINLTVTGGTGVFTYVWSNAATTQNITGLIGGTYYVTITDANSCSLIDSATVTQSNAPQVNLTAVQITCSGLNNAQINTAVTGGTPNYTYTWNDAITTQNRTNLSAATYTVTVHDSNNCTSTASEIISSPAPLNVSLIKQDELCAGNTNANINSTVTGGTPNYTYAWSNAATTANLTTLAVNTYTVTITDSHACTATASAIITQPQPLTANAMAIDDDCFGDNSGSVTLTVTGGTTAYQFSWSDASTGQNIQGAVAGNYTVTVTDNNACTATATAVVNQPTAISLTGAVTNATCFGSTDGAINLTVTGGTPAYLFTWSNGSSTQNQNNISNGIYHVQVSDSHNCLFLDSFTVNSLPAIVVNPVINNVNCFGGNNGSVSLTVTGGSSPYTYLWSNNATTQNEQNITAGTYAVTVTDAALCNTVVSGISVTQPVALSATITSTPQLCNNLTDGTATITVTGGTSPYQYSWSNGMSIPAITGLTTAEYYVTATDVNNCIYSDSVFVAIVPSMLISAIDTPPSCPTLKDGFILTSVTNGTHPYSYIWSNGQSTAHATGLGAGNYSVTIADANGCSLTDNFLLQAPGAPTVSASATPDSLSLGQSTVLTAISNNNTVTYNWTPSYGLSCINCSVADAYPYTTTLYTVLVVDSNGCTATDSVLITVSASGSVYIPNAFTPNGDGNNDVFQIYGEGIKIIDLKVFNRWGEKVYESNNQFEGWDGTYKGSKQNPSVFVYEANITYLNDKKDFKKGSVTLIR